MNIMQFIPKSGYECLNACILNWINYFQKEMDSSDIYFSGYTSLVQYDKSEKKLLPSAFQNNIRFLEKYQIGYHVGKVTDAPKSFLEQSMNAHRSLTLKTELSLLTYTNLSASNQNAPHYINVLDIDCSSNKIFICDGYIPTLVSSSYANWTDLEKVCLAWSKREYSYVLFDGLDKIDVDMIRENAKQQFFCVLREYLDSSSYDGTILKGTKASLQLFEDFFNQIEEIKNVNQSYINQFFFELKVYGFLIEKQMIYEKLCDLSLCCAVPYLECIKRWNNLLFIIRKEIISNKIYRLKGLYSEIVHLIETEQAIYKQVLDR